MPSFSEVQSQAHCGGSRARRDPSGPCSGAQREEQQMGGPRQATWGHRRRKEGTRPGGRGGVQLRRSQATCGQPVQSEVGQAGGDLPRGPCGGQGGSAGPQTGI